MKTKVKRWLDRYMVEIVLVCVAAACIFLLWQISTGPTIISQCEMLCTQLTNHTYSDNQTDFYACLRGCYENE